MNIEIHPSTCTHAHAHKEFSCYQPECMGSVVFKGTPGYRYILIIWIYSLTDPIEVCPTGSIKTTVEVFRYYLCLQNSERNSWKLISLRREPICYNQFGMKYFEYIRLSGLQEFNRINRIDSILCRNGQTYRLEFWHGCQLERYRGEF